MPRRNPGIERKVELAHAPRAAPFAQYLADWRKLGRYR
jgi:hypothetical protein